MFLFWTGIGYSLSLVLQLIQLINPYVWWRASSFSQKDCFQINLQILNICRGVAVGLPTQPELSLVNKIEWPRRSGFVFQPAATSTFQTKKHRLEWEVHSYFILILLMHNVNPLSLHFKSISYQSKMRLSHLLLIQICMSYMSVQVIFNTSDFFWSVILINLIYDPLRVFTNCWVCFENYGISIIWFKNNILGI